MDIQAITKRLYAISDAILEKTGEKPWHGPELKIKDGSCEVALCRAYGDGFKDYSLGTANGDTPGAALDAADAIIAALPAPETAKLHAHMARVADCIDKAHADGIADKYVTPLRVTVKAMSDNLLTVRAAE